MKISTIVTALENFAPPALQESYDNAGLLTGRHDGETKKALVAFDLTEEVLDEALSIGADLIIAHHPVIFRGLKKINGYHYVERVIIKAIKNDLALYAAHTNLDNVSHGTNSVLMEKLGVRHSEALEPLANSLLKLVVFVPTAHAEALRKALFAAGAGTIGAYDHCSYNLEGTGTFRASEGSRPFVGDIGREHHEPETRIETIVPAHLKSRVIQALVQSHPYEEVAYDLYPLENRSGHYGAGLIGNLEEPVETRAFLQKLKSISGAGCIKHTAPVKDKIKKVALCGGSGAFLIGAALRRHADIFITGDVKYHDFFEADQKMIIADIGHYESEQFTTEILVQYIRENFPTFAVQKSGVNTNPINYL